MKWDSSVSSPGFLVQGRDARDPPFRVRSPTVTPPDPMYEIWTATSRTHTVPSSAFEDDPDTLSDAQHPRCKVNAFTIAPHS